jgi:hypothetical protein
MNAVVYLFVSSQCRAGVAAEQIALANAARFASPALQVTTHL